MMQGPIQRLARHRVEPRADARLATAWIGGATGQPSWTDGAWLTRTRGGASPAGNAPALVLLGNGSEDARAALLVHAAAGTRVYALVGPGWGKDQTDSQVLQSPRVLVRRLAEVPVSAVHAGTEARLWIGGGFILRLDPTQAEALRQTFLRLFWHEATEEAWSGGRQFVWRPARERPFDVPEVPASASVRREPADARLSGDARGALMQVSGGPPPDSAPRRLWFPAGPEHHDRLAKLVQTGVEVLWADRGLPDLQVNGGAGEVLLPGTRGRLRVRLTAQQAPEVARLLEAPPAWQFQTNVRLGEASHRAAQFWLPGDSAARALEAEQIVGVPDVPATSLREVPATAPASVPAPQPLALAVRYQWTVVPPRVPMGAEEDALVGHWRKLDEDWTARLARLREALVAAEGDRGRIGRAFSNLIGAMLGFEHTHGSLLARVAALEAQLPSAAGPSGAPVLLPQLVELENAAHELKANLEEAERKAHEDKEREQQREEWTKSVQDAKEKVEVTRAELRKLEARDTELKNEEKDIQARKKDAPSDEAKDLDVKLTRNSDEQKANNDALRKLRHQIKTQEESANRPFEFNPKKRESTVKPSQAKRFVPTTAGARSNINAPEEALPEVGSLRIHKGQRYLVLQTWDKLVMGEQTAVRLNAKLVAPEDA
jgi:predicted  nucleic acid-binding Zn-ribbon protein